MHEGLKAAKRRCTDWAMTRRYLVGSGIDVGAGGDRSSPFLVYYPAVTSWRPWDLEDGDAQYLATVPDASLDFVHSSHCLEHLAEPVVALRSWARVLKPNGHLICTVPDEVMYEKRRWPSLYGEGHLWSFRITDVSHMPRSIRIQDLFAGFWSLERLMLVRDHYDDNRIGDQTWDTDAECAIEFVLRKKA